MRREKVLKSILDAGVVAVIRGDSKEEALKIVDAVSKGGIKIMELTMTVPNPIEVVKEVAEKYKGTDVIVGAGTVLDSETARACILAGAQFIVSPSLDEATLKLCNRYKVTVMPGVMTVKDAINIVKGESNAATTYLKRTTSPDLKVAFQPKIKASLDNVSATKYWGDLISAYNKIPFVKKMNPNLTEYVTGKAIDGLFVMIAKEELKIRKDPAARTSELLKKVFGK